jgi:hypothetical protein
MNEMTRFDRSKSDEVPERDSDKARRRTKPKDVGPASPKAIDALYAKNNRTADLAKGDHRDLHGPQFEIDQCADPGYGDVNNWLNGKGSVDRAQGANFDRGSFDKSSPPQKPTGPRNTASGKNMERSPFSAAHKTYSEE